MSAIIPVNTKSELAARQYRAGQAANKAASAGVFAEYISEKAANTIKRQRHGLKLFAEYLAAAGIIQTADFDAYSDYLQTTPAGWAGMTWGLITGFVKWQLNAGYAVSSVNVRLSTVKTYCRLANSAGVIDSDEYTKIKAVTSKSRKAAARIDEKRETTRVGSKPEHATLLTDEQARALKTGHDLDTAQGRRDALLMSLLVDHGLRRSEVEILTVSDIDLDAGVMTFNRPKLAGTQHETGKHELSRDTLLALRAYFDAGDAPIFDGAPLLRSSRKGGKLTAAGMSARAINKRVKQLAADMVGEDLSPHDCRHYAATRYGARGDSTTDLMAFFGWTSPAMAARYTHPKEVSDLAAR